MSVDDIIVVDHIAFTEKWKNLCNKAYRECVSVCQQCGDLWGWQSGI